ncbi:hypothetical protein [Kitasatospora xanthocidica]|uniref:hypothetical protein n=1 Tax=Kitasatospora xanthocidica TaxID=83382 RepID=UPI00167A51AA|nr:hypothetical protein [Kitasatospora xanthocidica]
MMSMQPVLEIFAPEGFTFWPTGDHKPFDHLVLNGSLTPAEVGTAVWRLADVNDVELDPEADAERGPRPEDPLDGFLHGLLTDPDPYAPGGLRVTDSATGTVFVPGCCTGLEEWRGWLGVTDGGGAAWFGHDPDARVEWVGRTVKLTQDADDADSPVIELPPEELRRLLAGAERDLRGFLALAAAWAERQLPGHAAALTAALARALDLEPPA